MTRINSAVQPFTLCDQHLLAEYREMPRIATHAWKHPSAGPAEFTLGKGHVRFFLDKGLFLKARFAAICEELQHRGFNLTHTEYRDHPPGLNGYYEPTIPELNLLLERIQLRMPPKPRYAKALFTRPARPANLSLTPMDNDLVNFRTLPVGSIFYLDAYYGNTYRKTGPGSAEFVVSRHGWNGQQLMHFGTDRAVRRQPLTPDEIELLGIDVNANPFSPLWTPPPEWALLGDVPSRNYMNGVPVSSLTALDLLGPEPVRRAKRELHPLL